MTALNFCLKKHKWTSSGFLYLFFLFFLSFFKESILYASTDEIHNFVLWLDNLNIEINYNNVLSSLYFFI